MSIELREITRDNWQRCIALNPGTPGDTYVSSNLYSLAEAKVKPSLVPLAIYDGDAMVGFIMYNTLPEENGSYGIYRVLVDVAHQHTGYGRAAVLQVVERMRRIPGCRVIGLDYAVANTPAALLYASLGFKQEAEPHNGSYDAFLTLS